MNSSKKTSSWDKNDGVRIFNIEYSNDDKERIKNDIDNIMNEAFLSNHKYCRKLENKLEKLHKKHYFTVCSSATTALEVIFRYINIQNKAVLVQSNTFIATGHAIQAAGGIIVPIDLDEEFTLSLEDLIKAHQDCLLKKINIGAVCVVNIAGRASQN